MRDEVLARAPERHVAKDHCSRLHALLEIGSLWLSRGDG